MQRGNSLRFMGVVATLAIAAACGGGDDDAATSTTAAAASTTAARTTAVPTTAPPTTAPPTTAPPTTAPPTTAAPTTAPPTTVPLTAATTVPATTTPPTAELAQFCFDSEQSLVAERVIDGLDAPTPAAVEASLNFLRFSIGAAAESAPPELAEEPERAVFLVDEIAEALGEYGFDPNAVPDEVGEELAPIIEEYTAIIADLEVFLSEACDSSLDTLDDQAAKLRPIIADVVTWDLVPIANQAGDVRLFVPEAWDQWFGSDELTLEVSFLQAAPDLQSFDESWTVPGVIVTVIYAEDGQADPSALVPETAAVNDCTETSSELYEDAIYTGELYRYTDCAEVGTEAVVVAVTDQDATSREILIEMQFPDGVDNAVVERFLAGFAAG